MLEVASTSSQPKLTKKQQKAASFKAKKGKGDRHVPDGGDLPAMDDDEEESGPPNDLSAATGSSAKASVSPSKKEKAKKDKQERIPDADKKDKAQKTNPKKRKLDTEGDDPAANAAPTESVKPKKPKGKATSAKAPPSPTPAPTAGGAKKTTFGDDGEVAEEIAAVADTESNTQTTETKAKPGKLILFVGNMPFDLSASDIAKHFGDTCGEAPSVRLLTTKGDPKAVQQLSKSKQKSIAKGKAEDPSAPQSKGCAFLEFASHRALQKALKFHHTMLGGRQINVELTAGGGGKKANRKEKIAKKNQALEKERQKIHETHIAPANASHKAKQAELVAKGEASGPPKKKPRASTDGEGQAQWGRRGGSGPSGAPPRRIPRFAASGANAVRLTSQ